jgi:hypothetical protein
MMSGQNPASGSREQRSGQYHAGVQYALGQSMEAGRLSIIRVFSAASTIWYSQLAGWSQTIHFR